MLCSHFTKLPDEERLADHHKELIVQALSQAYKTMTHQAEYSHEQWPTRDSLKLWLLLTAWDKEIFKNFDRPQYMVDGLYSASYNLCMPAIHSISRRKNSSNFDHK